MSESDTESGPGSDDGSEGISDEQLPEDLQPGEENPLASPPEGDVEEIDRDELDVLDGKTPEESEGGDVQSTDDSGAGDGSADGDDDQDG